MSQSDARILQAIGLALGVAVTFHLISGARARAVHAIAGLLSLAALIGPELG